MSPRNLGWDADAMRGVEEPAERGTGDGNPRKKRPSTLGPASMPFSGWTPINRLASTRTLIEGNVHSAEQNLPLQALETVEGIKDAQLAVPFSRVSQGSNTSISTRDPFRDNRSVISSNLAFKKQAAGSYSKRSAVSESTGLKALKTTKAGLSNHDTPLSKAHSQHEPNGNSIFVKQDPLVSFSLSDHTQKRLDAFRYHANSLPAVTNTSSEDVIDPVNNFPVSNSVTIAEAIRDAGMLNGYTIYNGSSKTIRYLGRPTSTLTSQGQTSETPCHFKAPKNGPVKRFSLANDVTRDKASLPNVEQSACTQKRPNCHGFQGTVPNDFIETADLEDVADDDLLALDAAPPSAPKATNMMTSSETAITSPALLTSTVLASKVGRSDSVVTPKTLSTLENNAWLPMENFDETALIDLTNEIETRTRGCKSALASASQPLPASQPLTPREEREHFYEAHKRVISTEEYVENILNPVILRPPFPRPVCDRSPVVGVSAETSLRTCFRIGEALNTGCQAVRWTKNVVLELYAKVDTSHRDPDSIQQHFVLSDLFHDRPPRIHGIYELWKGNGLWTYDSGRFLAPSADKKMCRAIGRMKREKNEWKMIILNIWEATWDDIEHVKGIICSW